MAPRKTKTKTKTKSRSKSKTRAAKKAPVMVEEVVMHSEGGGMADSGTMRKVFMGVLVLLFVGGVSYLIYDRVKNGGSDSTPAPSVGGGTGTTAPGGGSTTSPSPTPSPNQCVMERVTSGGQVDLENSTKAYIVSASLDESVGCQYESQMCSALLGSGEQACKDACAASSQCQFVRFTGDGIKCTFFADVVMTGSGAPSEPVFRKGPMCST